jgi:predicted DNA-binding transcriptional regulator AlpA
MQTAAVEVRPIKIAEVERRTGLSRSSIYRLARDGKFPAPFKLSVRASAFDSAAVDTWVHDRIAEARRAAA